jgi:dihydropteroate synthase
MSLQGNLQMQTGLPWKVGNALLAPDPVPLLMGIVNTTPDSFFDGGKHNTPDAAYAHAVRLLDEGATILDIGGESTRPGSLPVSAAEEMSRVLPVIERLQSELSRRTFYISVDTVKADVARAAMAAGAHIVNDVSALTMDSDMPQVVRETGASVVLNHMKGEPRTMQQNPYYTHVVAEVRQYLAARVQELLELGVEPERICLDPGIGFGKRYTDNVKLITAVDEILPMGYPVLMAMSRKSYMGQVPGLENSDRLVPSVVSAVVTTLGGASVLRVHDVAATREALLMLKALVSC